MMPKQPPTGPKVADNASLSAIKARVAARLGDNAAKMTPEALARSDPSRTFFAGRWAYLLVDCSASMTLDKRAEASRGSHQFLAEAIALRYSIGIIAFAGEANRLSVPTDDLPFLSRLLARQLTAPGTSTALDAGLALARSDLATRSGNRAIVVFTDGMPDNEASAIAEATKAKENGIDIIAVGTEDANLGFLERLASARALAVLRSLPGVADAIAGAAKLLPSGKQPSSR